MTTKTISAAEARKRFAEISTEVATSATEYVVLKNGKQFVKISPLTSTSPDSVSPHFAKEVADFMEEFDHDLKLISQN
jgi:antitoxin (DNA-binding transcriptional repressor) of toxin-antitoxin stability system